MKLLCLHILIIVVLVDVSEGAKRVPRIGIIGAGIGGSATAFYMSQLFGEDADITVFEKGDIGGRMKTLIFDGREYEVGGTIIHPDNFYMANFTQLLGLRPHASLGGQMSLYDGKEIVLTTSSYNIVSAVRFFWRYGRDIFKLQGFIDDMLEKFSRIYSIQDLGVGFTKPEDLLKAMHPSFVKQTHQSIKSLMLEEGFSPLFVDELVMAALQTNYGQTTDVHGFVGSISIAGALPGLWAVHGGNKQIPEGLIRESAANLIHAKVDKVSLNSDDRFELVYTDRAGEEQKELYDVVVLATPLHDKLTAVKFVGLDDAIKEDRPQYHTTVATFVKGVPNYAKFGFNSEYDFPHVVLATDPDLVWNSFGMQVPVDFSDDFQVDVTTLVWKIFSQRAMTSEEISELFTEYTVLDTIEWLAYPHYSSLVMDSHKFEIHPNLYYTSTIEGCASAMEMLAISARNVANLAYNKWNKQFNKIDLNTTHIISLQDAESKDEL